MKMKKLTALLLTALMSGGAEVQTAAELALTLPLLPGLWGSNWKKCLPLKLTTARCPQRQCRNTTG